MDILLNISGYIFFISLLIKIILHINIDNSNGYKIVVSRNSSWVYLMPYDKSAPKEYLKRIKICNLFQRLSVIFLFITIILLLAKNFI